MERIEIDFDTDGSGEATVTKDTNGKHIGLNGVVIGVYLTFPAALTTMKATLLDADGKDVLNDLFNASAITTNGTILSLTDLGGGISGNGHGTFGVTAGTASKTGGKCYVDILRL